MRSLGRKPLPSFLGTKPKEIRRKLAKSQNTELMTSWGTGYLLRVAEPLGVDIAA